LRRIASHRIASRGIASHRVATRRIAWYRVVSRAGGVAWRARLSVTSVLNVLLQLAVLATARTRCR
jgi:alkylated DNA nucleotide flippase Atl1